MQPLHQLFHRCSEGYPLAILHLFYFILKFVKKRFMYTFKGWKLRKKRIPVAVQGCLFNRQKTHQNYSLQNSPFLYSFQMLILLTLSFYKFFFSALLLLLLLLLLLVSQNGCLVFTGVQLHSVVKIVFSKKKKKINLRNPKIIISKSGCWRRVKFWEAGLSTPPLKVGKWIATKSKYWYITCRDIFSNNFQLISFVYIKFSIQLCLIA